MLVATIAMIPPQRWQDQLLSLFDSMIFPCTTAAFTIPHVLWMGFVMWC